MKTANLMMKFCMMAIAMLLFLAIIPRNVHAAAGAYDTAGFGTGTGYVTYDGGTSANETYNATLRLPDGKLIAIGSSDSGVNPQMLIARYDELGVLDTGFGTGGTMLFSHPNANMETVGLKAALQPDGKILVAGYYNVSDTYYFMLCRFNTDGNLDTTFGSGGYVNDPDPIYTDWYDSSLNGVHGLIVQPDGKIITAMTTDNLGSPEAKFSRYNSNGTLDMTFGTNGISLIADLNPTYVLGAVLDANGKIAATGMDALTNQLTLFRLNSNGILDTTFGATSAISYDPLPGGTFSKGRDLAIQNDGNIIVVGEHQGATLENLILRYDIINKVWDTNLAGGEILFGDPTFSANGLRSVILQPDGKILVAGSTNNDSGSYGIVRRYDSSGVVDSTFGTSGQTVISGISAADAMLMQPDGMIVVAGYVTNFGHNDAYLMRLTNDIPTHNVTVTTSTNGTVTPVSPLIVADAFKATLLLQPDPGYFAAVSGTCGGIQIGSSYFSNPITADCNINVTFQKFAINPGDSVSHNFAAGLPTGWTIIDNLGNGGWRFDDPGYKGNNTGGTSSFAIADSAFIGNTMDTELRSPVFDFSTLSNAWLEFKTDFQTNGVTIADVDVSTDAGLNWTNVWQKTGTNYPGPITETIDLTAYAGQSDVRIRFHYWDANYDWYWGVDDVRIYSTCSGATFDTQQIDIPFSTSTTNGSLNVTVNPNSCSLKATSNSPWITITSAAGTNPIQFDVTPTSELFGSITVAGQTIIVNRIGIGGVDPTFAPSTGYQTTTGTDNEIATFLHPVNDPTIFYKVSVGGTHYTIQRRKISDGSPLGGIGDGTVTGGFDATGRIILTTIAGYSNYPTKAALQSDDKIIVMGYTNNLGTSFTLLRLNTDGTLDTSFGTSGYLNESYFASVDSAFLTIMPTSSLNYDKILVGINSGGNASVVRYMPNGSPDNASGFGDFGEGMHSTTTASFYLRGMAIDPNERILLAGEDYSFNNDGWLMRLGTDGLEDTAFDDGNGHAGYVTFSNGNWDSFNAVAAQADGKIVVTGESDDVNNNTGFFSVLRYTETGALDTTFATGGLLLHGGADIGGNNFYDYGNTVAVQINGKIVAGGTEWNNTSVSADGAIIRLNVDGSFDTSFGYNGVATINNLAGLTYGEVNSISIQPDGKLLISGYIGTNNFTIRQTVGSPKIDILPLSPIDFGSLTIPNGNNQIVTITNKGESPLNVSNITLAGDVPPYLLDLSFDYSPVCGVTNPKLNPGKSCAVLVSINPTLPGTPTATLTVASDDLISPSNDIVFNSTILADTTPPVDGSTLNAVGGNANIVLSWSAANDASGIASYKLVYDTTNSLAANCSNGTQIYNGANLSFTQFDLSSLTTYYYRVCAVDASSNSNVSLGIIASATPTAPTKAWNGSVDGNWNTAGNWTPAGAPVATDDVIINLGGTYIVTLDTNPTVNSLILGGAGATPTLTTSASNTLTVTSSFRINSGATLIDHTIVTTNGSFSSDGTISGTGELSIYDTPNAILNTPINLGILTLSGNNNSTEATIPSGSVLGELKLFGGGLGNTTTANLAGNLVTAATTLTMLNNNNVINGPGTIINSSGKTIDLKDVTINAPIDNSGIISIFNSNATINGTLTTQPLSAINMTLAMSSLTITNGFTNFGDITITPSNTSYAGDFYVTNGALTNDASGNITVATVSGAGDTNIYAKLINQGNFIVNQNTFINQILAAHSNSGTVTVGSGVTLAIQNGTFLNDTNGKLQGDGTFDFLTGMTVSNSGTVTPAALGTSGKLSITGNLPDTANAFTNIDILAAAGAGIDYDQISLSGLATLGGTLNVNLIGGFIPNIGDSFTIMTCGDGCSGTFSSINYPAIAGASWDIAYNPTSVVLSVTPPTYTVTYNGNTNTGGTPPTDSSSYATGASVTVLGNSGTLTKTGYSFNGWNSAADGSGTAQAVSSTFNMGSTNVTLYAQWTINQYTVTFNSNGGSAVSSQLINYNANATTPTIPTKAGYTFAGWYSDAGLTIPFSFTTPITADITLYAQWTLIPTYTVTYNGNTNTGGTVPTDSGSYATGTSVTVLANSGILTKTGYTFNGWNTAVDGSGTAQAASSTFNMGSINVTLYAQWIINQYTVTFNSNSGSAVSSQLINYNANATTPTISTKAGYTFGGWYSDAGLSVPFAFTTPITADITLYAQWTLIPPVSVDVIAPAIIDFTVPSTNPTLTVPITTFIATDTVGVTGYLLSEDYVTPSLNDPNWSATPPATYTFATWGNQILYAFAKDAAGNISASASVIAQIGPADGIIIPPTGEPPTVILPQLADALKSLNFAMKVEIPTQTELLHGDVAPLVNGVPQPNGVINLGDTIVILRRVVGL